MKKFILVIVALVLSHYGSLSQTTICSGQCATLNTTLAAPSNQTNNYSVGSIAYAPLPFTGTAVTLSDDYWSNAVFNIGFNFTFFCNNYNKLIIGSNGELCFATGLAGTQDAWQGGMKPLTINGPFRDIIPIGNNVFWQAGGISPNRYFAVSWVGVQMYDGFKCPGNTSTFQIVLRETSNIIEVFIQKSTACLNWNSGIGYVGISGSSTIAAPGRNGTAWSATNEGWRFTPSGTPNYTFSWSQGGTVIGTSPSINVCPSTTTTYDATMVITTCTGSTPTLTEQQTVIVNPTPIISVSSSPPPSLCVQNPQSTLLLSATSSVPSTTFNWSPSTGLSCSSCANPTLTNPGSTTTYQVTGTVNGCSGTANITVTVQNCLCQNGIVFNNTQLSNANQMNASVTWSINNNITIPAGSNVTLFNKTLYFAPNVSITVMPGASLTLTQCYLTACTDMWQGIIVSPGASLTVQKGVVRPTRIEDAISAIDCSNWNQTGNTLIVNGAVFNRNLVSIKLDNFQWAGVDFPATIQNVVFTCRKNITAANAQLLKNQIYNQPLQSPYFLRGLPVDVLKNPYAGQPPQYGISITDVGATSFTGNSPINTPAGHNIVTIGASSQSNKILFDRHAYGIFSYKSNTKIMNSDFQIFVNFPGYLIGNSSTTGTGIFSFGKPSNSAAISKLEVSYPGYVYGVAPPNFPNSLPADNCNFYDCFTAVVAATNAESYISGTKVQSTQSINTQNGNMPGATGIYVLSRLYVFNDVSYNELTNVSTAINFNAGPVGICQMQVNTFLCTSLEYIGETHIDNNIIQNDLSGGSSNISRFVKYPILANNTLNCQATPPPNTTYVCYQEPNALTSVNNNFIYNAFNGIYMSNWQLTNPYTAQTQNNYIQLANDPQPFTDQFGISHANNINNIIFGNNVLGFGTTRQFVRGIWAQMNTTQLIQCNQTTNLERGMEFLGNNAPTSPTQWMDNTMLTNKYGLYMDAATIGLQNGTGSNAASDNKWIGPGWNGTSSFQTFNPNNSSNLNNSALVCRFGSQYFPIFNGPTGVCYGQGAYQSALISATPSVTRLCPPLPVPCTNCRVSSGNRTMLEQMANGTLSFNVLNNSSRTIGQIQLLRALSRDNTIMDSSVVLQNFYQNSPGSQADLVNTIERELMQGGAGAAQNLLPSLNSSDAVINSHKTFFATLISMQNGTYSAVDSASLYALATACPLEYGTAVYQARTLYDIWYRTVLPFTNNCSYIGSGMREMGSRELTGTNSEILLFPNPSDGSIYITGFDLKMTKIPLEITDITGKVITKMEVLNLNGVARLDCDQPDGMYMIIIHNSGGIVSKKLMIKR